MPGEGTRWIVGPLVPHEVTVKIAADGAAQFTPELRQALDQLVQGLRQHDVEAYANGASLDVRRVKTCDLDGKSQPEITSPRRSLTGCRIVG
jgi:hypothetical protein